MEIKIDHPHPTDVDKDNVIQFDPAKKKPEPEQTNELGEIPVRRDPDYHKKGHCWHHPQFILDNETQTAKCKECGAILSSWNVLLELVYKWERYRDFYKNLRAECEIIAPRMERLIAELDRRLTDHRAQRGAKLLAEAKRIQQNLPKIEVEV